MLKWNTCVGIHGSCPLILIMWSYLCINQWGTYQNAWQDAGPALPWCSHSAPGREKVLTLNCRNTTQVLFSSNSQLITVFLREVNVLQLMKKVTTPQVYYKSTPLVAPLHLALCSGHFGMLVPHSNQCIYFCILCVCVFMCVGWCGWCRSHNGIHVVPAKAGKGPEVIFLQLCFG